MTSDSRLLRLKELLKDAIELENENTLDKEIPKKLEDIWSALDSSKLGLDSMPTMQEFLTELQVLHATSSYLGKYIRHFEIITTKKFTLSDYADKLLSKLSTDDNGQFDWMEMTRDAVRIINRAPGIPVLVGTFDTTNAIPVQAERKRMSLAPRMATVQRKDIEKETPDEVQNIEADVNSVDIKVNCILKLLRDCYKLNKYQPISFYKFVLHPNNFTTTVENIFHVSFIIRDGLARLAIVDDDLVIEPVENSKHRDEGSITFNKQQMIFSITMDEWKDLVEAYYVRKPAIE